MINEPVTLVNDSFQHAWLDVARLLIDEHKECRNLMVQIKKPDLFNQGLHDHVTNFTRIEGMLLPRHVAYTIFPHDMYRRKGDGKRLFDAYNRPNGLFDRLQKRKPSWGTYFRRLTHYDKAGNVVNQLAKIIEAIQNRKDVSRAAYTAVIQSPGNETTRPRGGPCLNYLAVQLERGNPTTLGLLAVYRNHDFLERSYGNYWGLCNLLRFMSEEVGAKAGPLTCISSRAYVDRKRPALRKFVEEI